MRGFCSIVRLTLKITVQEPLNSEDDVSDEDPTDLFDTDNVVVCQYDKVSVNHVCLSVGGGIVTRK
jgi:hypothetical protein